MPNWFPSWTKCCDPANYRALPLGAMIAIGSVGILMGAATMLVAIAPGVAIILAALCVAAIALSPTGSSAISFAKLPSSE